MRIAYASLAAFVAGILSAPGPAAAYVGQWHSYTDQSRVNALMEHQGFVYAGTSGGIRRIAPTTLAEFDFDNLDGLLDPWITAFLHDEKGVLWAVAHDGYLYTLSGNRWEATGRSYASLGWKMNDRAALAAGNRFYLGSEKGLTIFDAVQKISLLNVTRFQNELNASVFSLLRRGDTLFAGTSRGIYEARVYFADPLNPPESLGYANLADPGSWTRISADVGYSLAVSGDSVVAGDPGTLIETPVRVEAFLGRPVKIGNQTYSMDWSGFKTAVETGGRVFIGGDPGLFVSQNPSGSASDARAIEPLRAYPRDTIFNVGAYAGKVWAHSPAGLHTLNTFTGAFTMFAVPTEPEPALTDRNLRNTKVDANGDVYLGTWGFGLHRFREGAPRLDKNHGTDPCIYQAVPPTDPWTVAMAISAPRNGGLYFSVFRTEGGPDHQLVYFDTQSETIFCPDSGLSVPGGYPHAIQAFSDSLLGVATNRGVALFKTRASLNGPLLEPKGLWSVKGLATEAWDLATDHWGRPWALIGSTLGSLNFDSLDVSTNPFLDGVTNFGGEECKSLESDASGTLWVGCANGLYNVTTGVGGDLSAVRRYGLDDGLLSLTIFDVTVDPTTGKVWIATDRGLSMLESAGQPAIPSAELAAIVPYPNPFKPEHRFVIFGPLPRNSTLRIHDAAGNVVRIFRPADLNGNQAQWDGKNDQGRAVSPGVYLFSVTSGSRVQRGKIIVAR